MTVLEVMELIKDKDASVIVYDNETNKILNVDLDDLHYATVKALSSDGKSFKVFVDTPKQDYFTYFDVTYSTRIDLGIPEWADKKEVFRLKAAEIASVLPNEFNIKGYSFSYTYDNRETGGLEDMIEKC